MQNQANNPVLISIRITPERQRALLDRLRTTEATVRANLTPAEARALVTLNGLEAPDLLDFNALCKSISTSIVRRGVHRVNSELGEFSPIVLSQHLGPEKLAILADTTQVSMATILYNVSEAQQDCIIEYNGLICGRDPMDKVECITLAVVERGTVVAEPEP